VPSRALDAFADAIAATSTHLYWLDFPKGLMRKSFASGVIEKLAETQGRGTHLFVDSTRVFWEELDDLRYAAIYTMPFDGSAGVTRLAAGVGPWAVGTDRVFYWKNSPVIDGGGYAGEIDAVPKTGGAPSMLASNVVAGPMAADGTGVYWYDPRGGDGGMGFFKLAFPGNEKTWFVDAMQIRYMVANGNRVLWEDESEYFGSADIRWALPDGKSATVVAHAQPAVLGLGADEKNAYWLTSGPLAGTGPADLATAPLGGGTVLKLACGIQFAIGMAVADDGVYVSSALAVVWKVPKAP
jgi:hypothetical protein